VSDRRAWLTQVREFPPEPDGAVHVARGPLRRLADRVRARRVELGLSRAALAQAAGVPHATIKHFERTGMVSLAALYLLAIELGRAADLDAVCSRRRPDSPAVLQRRVALRRRGRAGTATAPPR
jgi:transcriptional regulator with XRE-family HTH domain